MTKFLKKYNHRIKSLIKFAYNIISVCFIVWFVNECAFMMSGNRSALRIILAESIIFTIMYLAGEQIFKINKVMWRFADYVDYIKIILASTISNLASIFILSLFVFVNTGLMYKFWFFVLMTVLMILSKLFAVFAYKYLINKSFGAVESKDAVRTLVVGGGDAGCLAINEYTRHAEYGVKPVAIIDDDRSKRGLTINGVPIVGDRSSIPDVVRNMQIQEIVIAMPSADETERQSLLNICIKTKAKIKIMPSFTKMMDKKDIVRGVRDVNINDLLGRNEVNINTKEDYAYLKDKVVLVTGGGGSIGSELSRQVAASDAKQLLILDFYENNAYNIQQELRRRYGDDLNMQVIITSVRDVTALENVFATYKPDVIFHAAAHKHVPLMEDYPKEAIKNNVFGTYNVAALASKYNAEKFILVSTDKAVNPTNIMGATKRVAEMIIQSFNKVSDTKFAAVRFGNVLGSNGSVIPLFLDQIKQGGPVTITHPEITRFFMTIREAASLVIQAGTITSGGEIFILDMGEPVKIDDLARNLITLSGYEPDKDIKIEYVGLRPGEKLYEELMLDEEGIASTTYKKIFIANPVELETQSMKIEVDNLRATLNDDDFNAKKELERLVPTYRAEKIKS